MKSDYWKKMFEEFVDDSYFDLGFEDKENSDNENNEEVVNMSEDDYEIKKHKKKLN